MRHLTKAKGHGKTVSQRVHRLYRKPHIYCLFWALGMVAHFTLALPPYGLLAKLAACGLLGLALASLWEYVNDPVKAAPIVPVIMLEFYLLYGFAQFSQFGMLVMSGLYIPSEDALTVAAYISLVAAVMFLIGQRAGMLLSKKYSIFPWLSYPSPTAISPGMAVLYAACTLVYALLVRISGQTPDISVRNILSGLLNPEFAFLLLLFFYFKKPNAIRRLAAYATFVVLFIFGLAGGMLEGVIAPIFIFFVSAYMWKGQVKLHWPVIILVIYVVLTPAKYEYRRLQEWGQPGQVQTSLQDKIETWEGVVESTWSDPFAQQMAWESSVGRTSFIIQLAQVIELTPSSVPYNQGEGFGTALLFIIPRLIWPGKPSISDLTANRYATIFDLTTDEGTQTSTIGIFQPTDGYWDWGILGSMGYPFLYGAIISVFFFGMGRDTLQARLLAALFTVSFFQGLAALSTIIASLASLFVFSWVVLKVLEFLSQVFFQPQPQFQRSGNQACSTEQ